MSQSSHLVILLHAHNPTHHILQPSINIKPISSGWMLLNDHRFISFATFTVKNLNILPILCSALPLVHFIYHRKGSIFPPYVSLIFTLPRKLVFSTSLPAQHLPISCAGPGGEGEVEKTSFCGNLNMRKTLRGKI